ncbi:hypothetical protein N8988_02060 [Opitutales bacterium]|nr:hypothetical protein [Opitutales bacterium]
MFLSLCFGYVSCSLIQSRHHIVLDHNITIKIEQEVEEFINNLYHEEPKEQVK